MNRYTAELLRQIDRKMAGRDILRWEELCSVKIESKLPIKKQSPFQMKKEDVPQEPTPPVTAPVQRPAKPEARLDFRPLLEMLDRIDVDQDPFLNAIVRNESQFAAFYTQFRSQADALIRSGQQFKNRELLAKSFKSHADLVHVAVALYRSRHDDTQQ